MSSKRYDIQEIKQKDLIFNSIISDNKYELHWDEIMKFFQAVCDYHPDFHGEMRKTYLEPKHLFFLEEMGLNYNHLDSFGNNFLHYILSLKESSYSLYKFYDKAVSYITSQTENIYLTNNANEHILFNMLSSLTSGGLEAPYFFDLVNNYPEFNLDHKNNQNRSLLYFALLKNAPPIIIDHLIENKVSLSSIDNDGNSFLHILSLSPCSEHNKELLNKFILVNDVTHANNRGETMLGQLMSFYLDKNSNRENRTSARKWLNYTFNLIANSQFLYNPQICDTIYEYLQTHKTQYLNEVQLHETEALYLKSCSYYDNALKSVSYFKLQATIAKKDNTLDKSNKIKI